MFAMWCACINLLYCNCLDVLEGSNVFHVHFKVQLRADDTLADILCGLQMQQDRVKHPQVDEI